eukprot:gb/GEZN01018583.1/.p1 GENE.gb/GEZN01018583.1/~~gb/GEZN01018583.1/.p1  ORF type:complete len:120 (+),score=4.81 gb/GEZN01018583.1/:27-362(+)
MNRVLCRGPFTRAQTRLKYSRDLSTAPKQTPASAASSSSKHLTQFVNFTFGLSIVLMGFVLTTQRNISWDSLVKTDRSEKSKFVCLEPGCNKSYAGEHLLEMHMRSHEPRE